MEDRTYNGWTNYETWAVGMFLDGNYDGEGTYLEVQDITARCAEEAETSRQVETGIWTVEEARKYNLADELKEYTEAATEGLSGIVADLFGAALSEVNWDELAEAQLSALPETA